MSQTELLKLVSSLSGESPDFVIRELSKVIDELAGDALIRAVAVVPIDSRSTGEWHLPFYRSLSKRLSSSTLDLSKTPIILIKKIQFIIKKFS